MIILWLVVPLTVVLVTLLYLRKSPTEFKDVDRREQAMKALGSAYDPEVDTVLRSRWRKEMHDAPTPD